VSYYIRALQKLEDLETSLSELSRSHQARAATRLTARGLVKTVREVRFILEEWRYEPYGLRRTSRPPPKDDEP